MHMSTAYARPVGDIAGAGGGHLEFPIGMILAIFDLQVTPIIPTLIQVNWPFGSGETKNGFPRWWPWRPSWISDRKILATFDTQVR